MRRRGTCGLRVLAVVTSWMVGSESRAFAGLREDVATLRAGYRQLGAEVVDGGSFFLAAGQTARVPLPVERTAERPCLTVVGLAARGIGFSLQVEGLLASPPNAAFEGDGPEPEDEEEAGALPGAARSNRAGVATWTSCVEPMSVGAPPGASAVLGFSSPRGAVELVFVTHRAALPPVGDILLERAELPPGDTDEPLPPLGLAALAERVRTWTMQARQDGARSVESATARASEDGSGARFLRLTVGCHRLGLFVDARGMPADLDAEVRVPGASEPFRVDRSHAPEARLEVCVSEPREFELRWLGAGGPRDVTLLDARWELPEMPLRWSASERTAVAWGLWKRRAPRLDGGPVREWRGQGGLTTVAVRIEPRACYLVALGAVPEGGADAFRDPGEVVAARIRASVGLDLHQDEAVDAPRGASASFCAGASRLARISVEARGRRVAHRFAMWRVGETSP